MEFNFLKEPGRQLDRPLIHDDVEPLVSIITPYYNAGHYFEQTFNCVMNQTFPWFEWIIVDDGSTDEKSMEILKEFQNKDSRIRVCHKENGGISTARNLAIRKMKSDIVIPLDADDLIEPTYVEILYWALYYHPDCSWAYSNSVGFQNQQYVWDKPFDAELLRTENFLVATSAIRKTELEEVGCYDETTKHYNEDWRVWLKFLSAHKRPVKTSNFGFWYRRVDTGVLSKVNDDSAIQDLAKKLIQEVAETVDTSIRAYSYPLITPKDQFVKPSCSKWDRKTATQHVKTNVLMLLPWMEMGGADLFNLHIAQRLNRDKFDLGIITTEPGENRWQQQFAETVSDVFNLPEFLDEKDWPEFISYYIKSRQVDILFISNSYYGYYLLPWLRSQFPSLVIMDYVHMEEWYWRGGGYARTSAVFGGVIEHTYVCNGKTKNVIAEDMGRGQDTVDTLYIGVDTDEFDPNQIHEGLVREELGLEGKRPIILFPCRIHQQKRPFLMMEIVKWTKKRNPEAAFVVVGDGPLLAELRKKTEEFRLEDSVFFVGAKQDLRPYYKDAAVVLICSIKEGLSLTAYEALSMGTPVITSDVGGQAELVNEDTGVVLEMLQDEERDLNNYNYSDQEIQQYVDAIEKLLENQKKYERICHKCRERVIEDFSVDRMIHKLEEIFTELTTNTAAMERRQKVADNLSHMSHLVEEMVTLGTEYALLTRESNSIWNEKESLRLQLEALKSEQKDGDAAAINDSNAAAAEELMQLKASRSYRLMQKYMRFMDNTVPGRILSRVRDCCWKKRDKNG